MVTEVKGRPYFLSSVFEIDDKEVGMTLDLCYHPYYPCLSSFLYSIPTFLSIICNCFLYLGSIKGYTRVNKGSKDGNRGQGSSLLFVLGLRYR